MRKFWIFNFCLILFFSCKKEDQNIDNKGLTIPFDTLSNSSSAVFIVNEGNFQWGNGSVSLYDVKAAAVEEDIFKKVNNRPLGDVVQSMEIFKGKGYLVVNNSQKIEVVDPLTFQSIGSINGLTSPRYFKGITSVKAYATDIWANKISVIDLISNSVIKQIPCKGWTEEMLLYQEKCFVANLYSEYLYVINTINDVVEDSIKISYGSNSLRLDKYGKLWVLCSGDKDKGFLGGIHRIDPISKQVELSLNFNTISDEPKNLRINPTADTLYYLNKGLYKMPITNSFLPVSSFISEKSNFYGLGVDPKSGEIYVSDAIDFVQKGIVFRYSSSGELKNSFKVGIIPGDFYFQ